MATPGFSASTFLCPCLHRVRVRVRSTAGPNMSWFGRKNEFKDLMETRKKQEESSIKALSDFDIRKVKVWGDAYPPVVYEMANQVFPNMMDTTVESLTKLKKLSDQWKPSREMLFSNHGPAMLAGLTTTSALYITSHFRRYLRLERYARLFMYSTACFFPAVSAGIINLTVSNYQIPLRGEKCRTCVAVKSAGLQSLASVAYPAVFACLTGFYYAQAYHTVPAVPDSFMFKKAHTIHVYKLIQSIAERSNFSKILFALFLGNLMAGYYVAEYQQEEKILMYRKILDRMQMLLEANRGAAVTNADLRFRVAVGKK